MDFLEIKERSRGGNIEVVPDFKVTRTKDLMVRGKAFYAIWDDKRGIWSTDEYDVQRLVDEALLEYRQALADKTSNVVTVKLMREFSTNSWTRFRTYLSHISDNSTQLDEKLTFQNTVVKKSDYVSKRLPYSLEEGPCPAFDEIIETLYDEDERRKLMWAIGSVVAGEAKNIQKFIVMYGEAGAGKSTILNIIQKLFVGYYTTFEAKALTSANNTFSTEVFRDNPLVAIQHDGDLSRIEDNTKLNSIVSHEMMTMNEKYKPSYSARANCFLFMATNKPVKISDAKSGIIRRLIDVRTSGRKVPTARYFALMSQIDFELGQVAAKCLKVFRELGKNFYSTYRPLDMIYQTDVFFNFVEANFSFFKDQSVVTLTQAYELYKTYCGEALIDIKLPRHKFREELKNYFDTYSDVSRVDGKLYRGCYYGFKISKFTVGEPEASQPTPTWLTLDSEDSLFDRLCADCPAQYTTDSGTPLHKWSTVTTKLSDLDTRKLHYVVPESNHIVIDFDIRDETGEKSVAKNMEAANQWPPTYAEYSKSERGIHLHYFYEGDITKLSNVYSEGIEIKIFKIGDIGPTSLRRKLSKCNTIPISKLSSGLPLKGEKLVNFDAIKTEKALRTLIEKNLRKEIHPGTKPSIDFIHKILEDAYASGLKYDVSDMSNRILVFAINSTNQADYCIKLVNKMKFKSEEPSPDIPDYRNQELVFFDVEVFPNLFLVCWKFSGKEKNPVVMINPTPQDIETFIQLKLVGFNCRRYDNHILYGRLIGYTIPELFTLSKKIIHEDRRALFGEAHKISYADVYDFSSKKQSLKKFQIELGLHHRELGIPWDEDVPEDKWPQVIEYCKNDVISLEAVFDDRKEDFVARQILAELSGLTVNDITQSHVSKIMFGSDPNPKSEFVYTDLSTIFPGYTFSEGKSSYRGEVPGEGGYVYAEPGAYENVVVLDIASMHPTSIELLNLFGRYTSRYSEIKQARVAIKHKDYDTAKSLLGGILSKFLTSKEESDKLSYALKIILNSVYGLTFANFDNKFRDPRNMDNIVAKMGALFMIDLKYAVQEKGFNVIHIKTDSIKIPNASKEIVDFVIDYGKKFGYTFEMEGEYDHFCLVNQAVYIARRNGIWTPVGAQFAQPYVFKMLFSKEQLVFSDFCEAKSVTDSYMYLNMNEQDPETNNYRFIGKTGLFTPILPGYGGGLLLREKDGKYYAVTGTKGYRWLESEVAESLGKECIDIRYFTNLLNEAKESISRFVDFEQFVN